MKQWLSSGIFRRVVIGILAVSLIPLLVLGGLALHIGRQAGAISIERGCAMLDAKAAETLELRTVETANAIARFLQERESDLRALALLPRSVEAYQAFYDSLQGDLWTLEEGQETHQTLPLYREMAYVDATGQEVIKIADGQVAARADLRDVSDPANTTYKSETYFAEARGLPPGEIYVGHVTGFYVSQADFTQGERFSGVLRFAMPVFDQDARFDGVVVLTLDSRHLAEFTEHIVPTDERFAAAPDPDTGNYAYLIDDQAYALAHPNDFVQGGLDEDGQPLPYATRTEDIGVLPIRLDQVGFVDENLASIPALAAQGEAGSIQYYWAGHDKFVAYAPVPYYGGSYSPPGGFGWVAIGANVETFHGAATLVGDAIQARVRTLGAFTLMVLALTVVGVLVVAALLARQVADPLQRVTEAARSIQKGEFHLDSLEPLLKRGAEDEITNLAQVFLGMADQIRKREQYRHLLDVVIAIGAALPQEKDFDRLLETVVTEAQDLCNAEAGTLYLREEASLRFVILRNEPLNIALGGTTGQEITYPPIQLFDETGTPNKKNVATYALHTGETVSIADAYQTEEFDFSGTKAYDERTGYRSQSFLSVPLKDTADNVVGVLQLINARDNQSGEVVPFDPGVIRIIESLATLGTIAVQGYRREANLREQITQLRIEIDQARRAEQVTQITETKYFEQLQHRARELRKRREDAEEE